MTRRASSIDASVTQKERLAMLEQQMGDARKHISEIMKSLEVIKGILDRAQGGYKSLLTLLAASSILGAIIAKIMEVFQWIRS